MSSPSLAAAAENHGSLNYTSGYFEISARIKRQNERRISVIIGNSPYNANQLNENENNKDQEYPEIHSRIKSTYVKASKAQKTQLYDMYVQFV
jgi:predicted helicase